MAGPASMPKNRFGGKNAKKMANKRVEDHVHAMTLPEEDGHFYARVTKRCGDGRFMVEYQNDLGNKVEGIARVPGSLRRLTRSIREGSIIIYQEWGLSSNDNKGSVLHLCSDFEAQLLEQSGNISVVAPPPDSVLVSASASSESVAASISVKEEEEDVFNLDDI